MSNIKNISPLRYPGGKTRARKILWNIIEDEFDIDDINIVISPFFGGGSFEFYLQEKLKIPIIANDAFTPLISFWKMAKTQNEGLCEELYRIQCLGTCKDDFHKYREDIIDLDENSQKFLQAVYYFIINRCSFSGATLSGGFTEQAAAKRFTKSSVDRIGKLNLKNVSFNNNDFTEFLNINPTGFIFADPPYYLKNNKSNLYGVRGSLHKNFPHKKLYSILSSRRGWVLTYNNCDYIKDMYDDYYIIETNWSYGMSNNKNTIPKELIIICPF